MNEFDESAAAGIGFGMLFFYLVVWIITIAGMWKAFEKAGKPGWAAIIPIYNLLVMIEIVGKPTIWILFMLIPCVNIIFMVWMLNLVSKSFGQSEGFTVGLILLPIVFWPLLGFGSSYRYLGPSAKEAGGTAFGANNPFGNNFNNPFEKKDPNQPL